MVRNASTLPPRGNLHGSFRTYSPIPIPSTKKDLRGEDARGTAFTISEECGVGPRGSTSGQMQTDPPGVLHLDFWRVSFLCGSSSLVSPFLPMAMLPPRAPASVLNFSHSHPGHASLICTPAASALTCMKTTPVEWSD